MPIPWKSIWPALTVLALFAALSAGWYWSVGKARSAFKDQQELRAEKPALTCLDETWSGYPFRIQLDCSGPVLHLSRGRTKVTPKQLTASVRAPFLRTIVVELEGPIIVDNDKLAAPIEIVQPDARVDIVMESATSLRAEAVLSRIVVQQAGLEHARLHTARLRSRFERGEQHKINLTIDLTGVAIRTDAQDDLYLDAVAGTMAADNVPRKSTRNVNEWMKAAAELATQFNVEEFVATYGDTQLAAKGEIKIKASGYLEGSLKTRVNRLDALLTRLQAQEVLTASKARAAQTLLGLFDRGNGVAADLRMKNGELFWGPLKLGRHPVLF